MKRYKTSLKNFAAASGRPILANDLSFWWSYEWCFEGRPRCSLTNHTEVFSVFFFYGISGSSGVSTKGKRKPRQEEDEDYREFPQKKHKLYGKGATSLILFPWVHGLYSLYEKDLRFFPWSTFELWIFWQGMASILPYFTLLSWFKGVIWLREWGIGCWEKEGEILVLERG